MKKYDIKGKKTYIRKEKRKVTDVHCKEEKVLELLGVRKIL